jgi:predicted nucleic acid-binding protein
MYRRALDLRARWQLSFYDALIVAAALMAGCQRLLTEDLQHGQQIATLTIENPFLGSG